MFIENFLKYLQYEKRYSDNTLAAYQNDLVQFRDYLITMYQLENETKATHLHIRGFIVDLIEKKVTPRSVNRKISTLKSYYKFLKKRGVLLVNPMQKIISPKTSKRLPVYVEQQPMQTLLRHDFFTNDFKGQRDKLMIEIFYNTGIRRSELINLKLNDVNISQKTLKVLGKGNKERIIPFNEQLASYIQEYLVFRNEIAQCEYLLISDKGQKLNPSTVYNKVKEYLSKVTTLSKKSPHVLRHTFATHLTNKGAELNAIKELLGHTSLAATQVYTHNNIQKLKDIYKLSHPKA